MWGRTRNDEPSFPSLSKTLVLQPQPLCKLFCCTLWAIWGNINTHVRDKTKRSSQEIASFVLSYLEELEGVKSNKPNIVKEVKKWKPPPGQLIKINFDEAFD